MQVFLWSAEPSCTFVAGFRLEGRHHRLNPASRRSTPALLHQGNDPRSGIAEDTDVADIRTPDPGFWATTVSSPNRWCARRMSDQLVSAKVPGLGRMADGP